MDESTSFMDMIESATKAVPAAKFDPKRPEGVAPEQDTDAEGVPLWDVICTLVDEEARFGVDSETLAIRLASRSAPPIPRGGCAVRFSGLYLTSNPRQKGGYTRSLRAESAVFGDDAIPPSMRRSAPVERPANGKEPVKA